MQLKTEYQIYSFHNTITENKRPVDHMHVQKIERLVNVLCNTQRIISKACK